MQCEPEQYLAHADRVAGHYLSRVHFQEGFDTWGVVLPPVGRPDTLVIGQQSQFHKQCWPFMAVHEAIHSIGTPFFQADDYRFYLFNILEDWRINSCARKHFPDLEHSFLEMRRVILHRWESQPIQLKSPVSQVLQHLCYLNHLAQKSPASAPQPGYVREVLSLREQFGRPGNWPVLELTSDREFRNHERGERLLRLLQDHQPPSPILPAEICQLLRRSGYDLARCRDIELPED